MKRWLTALLCAPAFAGTVVIDTGHTPDNPGVIAASGAREYDYNARFVRQLKTALSQRGHKVVDVAASGLDKTLPMRSSIPADLFISIHHDSIPQEWINAGRQREFSGYSIFVSHRNPHPSLACAIPVGRAMRSVGELPSLYHATPITGENRPLLDAAAGVHRYDDLIALRTAQSPALLLEVGVLANPNEENSLRDSAFIWRAAHAVADGIHQCIQGKK